MPKVSSFKRARCNSRDIVVVLCDRWWKYAVAAYDSCIVVNRGGLVP